MIEMSERGQPPQEPILPAQAACENGQPGAIPVLPAKGVLPEAIDVLKGLSPAPLLSPKRKVDLTTVEMSGLPEVTPVEQLIIHELKGIGATFTPNMEQMLSFHGLVYTPDGEFSATYQLIGGQLQRNPRVMSRTKAIAFVPCYSWPGCEVVLAPFKLSRFGSRVLQTMRSLTPRFPNVKVWIEWSDIRKRHIVQEIGMTPQEQELIGNVVWPGKAQIIEALQLSAFDDLDELAAANTEIKTLLNSREVE